MARITDFEIDVAGEMVREEADAEFKRDQVDAVEQMAVVGRAQDCLLYTSDAADE